MNTKLSLTDITTTFSEENTVNLWFKQLRWHARLACHCCTSDRVTERRKHNETRLNICCGAFGNIADLTFKQSQKNSVLTRAKRESAKFTLHKFIEENVKQDGTVCSDAYKSFRRTVKNGYEQASAMRLAGRKSQKSSTSIWHSNVLNSDISFAFLYEAEVNEPHTSDLSGNTNLVNFFENAPVNTSHVTLKVVETKTFASAGINQLDNYQAIMQMNNGEY